MQDPGILLRAGALSFAALCPAQPPLAQGNHVGLLNNLLMALPSPVLVGLMSKKMLCFLPRQQLGCYSFPKSSSGINWTRGLLPGLGITHAMEPSRGRAAASQGLSAPPDASVRARGGTLTCWGLARGKGTKRFKRAGYHSVCQN